MLIERQASKKKQIMLIVVVALMNVVVGYLVYNNFFPKKRYALPVDEYVDATPPQVSENIAVIEALTRGFDRTLLDSPEFKALEKYGSWPVGEAVTGRTNPFLPTFGP